MTLVITGKDCPMYHPFFILSQWSNVSTIYRKRCHLLFIRNHSDVTEIFTSCEWFSTLLFSVIFLEAVTSISGPSS